MRTVLGYIKFISRRNLIFPVVVLILMVILFLVLPVRSTLYPDKARSVNEIIEHFEKGSRYLDVEISDLKYTGYDYFSGNKVVASYYYLLDEDNSDNLCLFFLIPAADTGIPSDSISIFSGKVRLLVNNVYFSQFLSSYASDIGWSNEGLTAACKGVLLSRYDYHPTIYVILAILIMAAIILSLFYIIMNLLILLNPSIHEACKRLRRFGLDASDFREIDSEIKNNCILHSGNLYVTDHYFVAFTSRSIYVIPLYNIVWAYKYSTMKRFSRSNKLNYSMMIVTDPKDQVTVPGNSKKDIDNILRFLHGNYKHITVGYSEENRRKFESK